TDKDDQLIAIGNTNDLDTLVGAGTYYRSFAVRFGSNRHHHGCDDAERPGIESAAMSIDAKTDLPLTGKPVVYPNPAQDQLTISNIDKENYNSLAVYNMLGTLLFQQTINSNTARLDVSTLSGGVYVLVLRSSLTRKEQQLRFVVKR
ncbi:MAG TPA: T9SS type A sorting domain-containing protein, partial [Chitinophagaceae bacterium]|nr:T9SS type A sorting domain-containing protein [Chitinophagaceae bacterium]